MLKLMGMMSFGMLLTAGCASNRATPKSWLAGEAQAIEQVVQASVPSVFSDEGFRLYAAAAILIVLALGCWSRVSEGRSGRAGSAGE